MPFPQTAYPGTIHHIAPRLLAFEHSPPSPSFPTSSSFSPPNTLLWLGGLGDSLLNVPYPTLLAHSLPPHWTLARALLSSAHTGWGVGSLAQDASELGQIVEYFRRRGAGNSNSNSEHEGREGEGKGAAQGGKGKGQGKGKVVLMGHSTGAQGVLEYVVGPRSGDEARPPVQGIILQGCVSDREALVEAMGQEAYSESVEAAAEMVGKGQGEEIVPGRFTGEVFGTTPVSARRWLSLTSANKDGEDDYFSSDLGVERLRGTFGRLGAEGAALLVLMGGRDEYVPEGVDKEGLVGRWGGVVREGGGSVDERNGGVVPGASHSLVRDGEGVVRDLVERVVGFLGRLDGGDFERGANL